MGSPPFRYIKMKVCAMKNKVLIVGQLGMFQSENELRSVIFCVVVPVHDEHYEHCGR